MIYSFFDVGPDARKGLGTYIILDHIVRAARAGLPYVYLGYWVEGSTRMAYKTSFRPLERLGRDGWRRMDEMRAGEREESIRRCFRAAATPQPPPDRRLALIARRRCAERPASRRPRSAANSAALEHALGVSGDRPERGLAEQLADLVEPQPRSRECCRASRSRLPSISRPPSSGMTRTGDRAAKRRQAPRRGDASASGRVPAASPTAPRRSGTLACAPVMSPGERPTSRLNASRPRAWPNAPTSRPPRAASDNAACRRAVATCAATAAMPKRNSGRVRSAATRTVRHRSTSSTERGAHAGLRAAPTRR